MVLSRRKTPWLKLFMKEGLKNYRMMPTVINLGMLHEIGNGQVPQTSYDTYTSPKFHRSSALCPSYPNFCLFT